MRLLNVIFIALIAFVLFAVGYVYIHNFQLLSAEVVLWENVNIRISTLLICVFLLGFVLNLLYTGIMELTRMVRSLNASAATRAGKRISLRVQDARDLVAHGLYGDARKVLADILEERPDHEQASLLYGEVLLKLGDPEKAVTHLQDGCAAHPERIEARYLLAEVLAEAREVERTVAVLSKLAGEHPKQALRALRRLRALHVEGERWDEALDVHKRLVSRFSAELALAERAQGVALTYQAGMQKVEADRFKEAAGIFQQVLKEDATFVPAYLSLGRCMILQDQEGQGLEIWLEGFRATGEGALLQEIEDYFIQGGRPEEGLVVLRRVAATSEHATAAKFFLGKMLYRLEMLDEALDLFQEVRAQVVYSPVLFFFMAKIHARRGRKEQALNEYRHLLRNLGVLKLRYECSVCGHRTNDYEDLCDSCGSWNSVHFLFKEQVLSDAALRPEGGQWVTQG